MASTGKGAFSSLACAFPAAGLFRNPAPPQTAKLTRHRASQPSTRKVRPARHDCTS